MPSAINEFRQAVRDIVALYHDSRVGYRLALKQLMDAQKLMITLMPGDPQANSVSALDARAYTHGKGEPWGPASTIRHTSTQGAFKARNAEGGPNHHLIGNLCLVAIYQYWEDEFRNAIAGERGVKRADLKASVFGDIRILRNAILHNAAVATTDIQRCELLTWFQVGQPIAIDEEKFDAVAEAIEAYLRALEAV